MKKTKIVCTLGPATDDHELLKKIIYAGMNVARYNFSHGDHEEKKNRLQILKDVIAEIHMPVATMLDTKGPEIRIGRFPNDEPVKIEAGQYLLKMVSYN